MHAAALLIALIAAPAPIVAQTVFHEIEPNDTKPNATRAPDMAPGDQLAVIVITEPDLFRVRTAPTLPGIWKHEIEGSALLGRPQAAGVVSVHSSVRLQDPYPFGAGLRWYGFGGSEEIFVELARGGFCRGPGCGFAFVSALETTSAPIQAVPTAFPDGASFFAVPTPTSATNDLDFVLLDGDFDVLAESVLRRNPATGLPEARAVLTSGTYYLGVSVGSLATSEPASPLDGERDDSVLDFRGAVVGTRRDIGLSFELALSHGGTLHGSFSEPYEIVWYRLEVGNGQNVATTCVGDGSRGDCPGRPSAPGQAGGCANSTGRGGRLVALGSLTPGDVRFQLEDLPPGGAALLFLAHAAAPATPALGGILCLGPGATRASAVTIDALGRGSFAPSATTLLANGFTPGSALFAQAAYRDGPVFAGFEVNLTNGEALTIRP